GCDFVWPEALSYFSRSLSRVSSSLAATTAASPFFFVASSGHNRDLHSFPTRRSSDLRLNASNIIQEIDASELWTFARGYGERPRSEEHTSELQSRENLVCRLLLEKKKDEERRYKRRRLDRGHARLSQIRRSYTMGSIA